MVMLRITPIAFTLLIPQTKTGFRTRNTLVRSPFHGGMGSLREPRGIGYSSGGVCNVAGGTLACVGAASCPPRELAARTSFLWEGTFDFTARSLPVLAFGLPSQSSRLSLSRVLRFL